MRNPGGYLVITGPESVEEYDTFTCGHCQRVVVVKHKAQASDLGGMCRLCMKLVCAECDTLGSCTPFEKQMEEEEKSYRLRRAIEAIS